MAPCGYGQQRRVYRSSQPPIHLKATRYIEHKSGKMPCQDKFLLLWRNLKPNCVSKQEQAQPTQTDTLMIYKAFNQTIQQLVIN
jgi:hypothetical protein